ncbi:Mth938-like domain-containing protein [Chitinibacter bivalviorum]|uniref:Mth938-like domain-containing protein n=1 Tax=Chitinibacter bivalviorum TaxID=2739434 RepID=A0A7H9BHH1_9NEIS|nr:Mth938-like domain-containing protein [Chitinibacter bivalviorum]QLG86984.1 Mth938-like domain-containing protein [Chitinibacter bivalviorum]
MKLHQSKVAHLNQITAYDHESVHVNQERHAGSILILPDAVQPWRPTQFSDLQESDFADLLALEPELVLLGTGPTIQFPHPKLYAALSAKHIGIDTMGTGALCRTFNVLVAEDRRVLALVLHA